MSAEEALPTGAVKQKGIEDFWIGKQLGQGAFARVYHVRSKEEKRQRDFAIKVMEKKFIIKEKKMPQVQMERLALSELNHPFIIHLYFSFHDYDRLYLVMDLCPYGELARVIKHHARNNRALNETTARFYFSELVCAVQHVHSKGFLHRDIKPENVLISKHGHVKLTDFGTAKRIDDENHKDTFCGTAEYVSPEVLLGEEEIGVGADYWALGVCLYNMLVGRTPFWYESEFLTFQCILQYAGKKTEEEINAPEISFAAFPEGSTELSSSALSMVRALLQPSAQQRLCGEAVLQHEFLVDVDFSLLMKQSGKHHPVEVVGSDGAKMLSPDLQMLDGANPDVWLLAEEEEDVDFPENNDDGNKQKKKNPLPPNLAVFLREDEEKVKAHGPVVQFSFAGLVQAKRYLIITNTRAILVDAVTMSLKEELSLMGGVEFVAKPNGKDFELVGGGKRVRARDLSGELERWKLAL